MRKTGLAMLLLVSSVAASAQSQEPITAPAPAVTTAPESVVSAPAPAVAAAPESVVSAPAPAVTKAPGGVVSPRIDWKFMVLNGALAASSVANVETLMRCTNCTAVPDSMRSRTLLYGMGLPIDAGLGYLGNHMRKNGNRWWFVPAVAATAANAFLAYHWASRTP